MRACARILTRVGCGDGWPILPVGTGYPQGPSAGGTLLAVEAEVRVIGITGSVGKSTTKELIAEVLGRRYRTLKNPGNLNNEIRFTLTLLSLSEGHERAYLRWVSMFQARSKCSALWLCPGRCGYQHRYCACRTGRFRLRRIARGKAEFSTILTS